MSDILKRATVINEKARQELDISRDEYALCSYVLYRSADPRQKVRGYCCDRKEDIAAFIGITRPGLYKMIDRMERLKLVAVDPVTSYINCTALFIDIENECKQSLQKQDGKRVNKVYKQCKQSLHGGVNKVTPIKEDIKSDKEDININKEKEPPKPPKETAVFTLEESTEAAIQWCKENTEQVKYWMNNARVKKDDDEFKTEVLAFFSHYRSGTSDQHEIRKNPVRYFSDRFPGWLINSKNFSKKDTPRPAQKNASIITPLRITPSSEKQPF